MKYLRWLLLPFSLIYGLVVITRNWFYDAGIFKSYSFKVPVIAVGNLEIGGAGKSPMTEYLIRLFKDEYKLATLSRGYGRQTKGFLVAKIASRARNQESGLSADNLAQLIGDEPAQFKHKFPDVTVAVCEDRVKGISHLLTEHNLIILDDAYQHRAVNPGLNVLLFDYHHVKQTQLLLPAGNLREPLTGRWRAQIIIVSKCPVNISADEQNNIAQKIAPMPYQQLFFTSIGYQTLIPLGGQATDVVIDKDTTVFLLTGIANTSSLTQHLKGLTPHINHHKYPDHHPFTLKNIAKLAAEFGACASQKKIIITTEKDAQRLDESLLLPLNNLPVFVLPIQVEFLNESAQQFDTIVTKYVRKHTTHHSIH